MEVTAGDGRKPGLGDPREERLAVEQLDAIDQRHPPARINRERGRLPRGAIHFVQPIRMGGDKRRPLRASGAQSKLETIPDADELS